VGRVKDIKNEINEMDRESPDIDTIEEVNNPEK
jgi:hypothetical protein